jgi:hypothetical protein
MAEPARVALTVAVRQVLGMAIRVERPGPARVPSPQPSPDPQQSEARRTFVALSATKDHRADPPLVRSHFLPLSGGKCDRFQAARTLAAPHPAPTAVARAASATPGGPGAPAGRRRRSPPACPVPSSEFELRPRLSKVASAPNSSPSGAFVAHRATNAPTPYAIASRACSMSRSWSSTQSPGLREKMISFRCAARTRRSSGSMVSAR